jgi:predicted dehydrogenase
VPGFGGATASLEETLSGVPRFDSVGALLADGAFDGAVVCLPNAEAPEAVRRLAEAGKHVLAEKPMAGAAAPLRPVVEAVRASGVAFQSGYLWRYDEGADRLRAMVRDGRFGKLASVEMTFVTSDVARRGPDHYLFDRAASTGGFFNWLACHWLDLLLYVTGEAVVGVTARVGVFGATPTDVEDGGTAILELAGGALATFVGGYWLPRWAGESRWALRGSRRWVHWEPSRPGTGGVLEIHGPQPQWDAMDETFTLPADATPGYGGRRGVATVRDWLDAARAGGRPCRNTPGSALAVLELIDASTNRRARAVGSSAASSPRDPRRDPLGLGGVPLITHGPAVLAGVGAAHEHAGLGVDADGLVAAEAAAGIDQAVPLGLQGAADLGADARFEPHRAAVAGARAGRVGGADVEEPGGVARLLDVHAEVDQVAEHLHVPLRLHVAAHHAEAQPGPAVLGDEARDDRVERPLVRLQAIGVARVEREQAAAVLEREAQAVRDVPRAEAVEVALDQADAVEVPVDDRHVDRVGLGRVAGRRAVVGAVRVEQAARFLRRPWRSARRPGTLANSGSA